MVAGGNLPGVRLLLDVLWLLREATGAQTRYRHSGSTSMSRADHRELAQIMRHLPSQYADRLPHRAHRQIQAAAAAGQWEKAVETLIRALCKQAKAVTVAERDQLRAVLDAMNMSSGALSTLGPLP